MATVQGGKVNKSVKCFENPKGNSHMDLEMDRKEIKVEESSVTLSVPSFLLCFTISHKDFVSSLIFGRT